ncbi:hypothetical protein COU59_01350 [Candidatus Pacearchaeota archaeon CG10_big_fil_rev_8_21_14_0_10_34_12]|nr:MAG: hypothetical protein COU59_01350 [Candidatus Pacearchaeota archaeon CG10_big_fil_rev_8_21_14_0_10_34_12]
MWVIKASGKKEEFNPEKILGTLRRAGASGKLAGEIVKEVESKAYDGIRTRDILDIALGILRKSKPEISVIYDLKRALMNLGPTGFAFEKFFAQILNNYGYETSIGDIVKGRFTTHEVDVSARKKQRYMIECKYHNSPGTYTNLKVALYVYARFLDLNKKYDVPWLATNTRLSSNAVKYAEGVKMKITGWQYPKREGLQDLIEGKKLYPITILKSVNNFVKASLSEAGILLAKDILKHDIQELKSKTRIPENILKNLVEEAKMVYKVKIGKNPSQKI